MPTCSRSSSTRCADISPSRPRWKRPRTMKPRLPFPCLRKPPKQPDRRDTAMTTTCEHAPKGSAVGRHAWPWAMLALALLGSPQPAQAQRPPPPRPGKVLLIRGAFTVFSLGLDTLGDKLKEHGLDAEV